MKCIHHNDLDGRSAAAIVAFHTNDYNTKNYFELDYNTELPYDEIKKDETVYIVDYSFTKSNINKLDKLLKITKNVIWIDHHISSIELIKERKDLESIEGIRDSKESGVYLTYQYLIDKNKIPMFVKLISDFDTFKLSNKNSMIFKYGTESYDTNPVGEFFIKLINDKENKFVKDIISKGKIIEEYNKQYLKEYCDQYSFEGEIDGHSTIACNIRSFSLLFGDKIKNYDLACCFWFKDNKYTYSIYTTKKDINCSKIAEKFGGGGHPGASGFTLNRNIFKK